MLNILYLILKYFNRKEPLSMAWTVMVLWYFPGQIIQEFLHFPLKADPAEGRDAERRVSPLNE